jgi:thioredoxin-like negative regulator of GroEL
MSIKKEAVINRLTEIDVQEVSIVTNGANKKQWYLTKCADSEELIKLGSQLQSAKKGDIETVKAILKELLTALSDEALAELGLMRIAEDTPATDAPATTEAAAPGETEDQKLLASLSTQITELKKRLEVVSSVVSPSQTSGDPVVIEKNKPSTNYSTIGLKSLNKF